jgi:hypothetical protein
MHFVEKAQADLNLDLAVLFASYEDRCLRIPRELSAAGYSGQVVVFYCDDLPSAAIKTNLDAIRALFPNSSTLRPVSFRDSSRIINAARTTNWSQCAIIDISCFNRENLFPFLWAVRLGIDIFPSWVFGYSAPEKYGSWLSRDYEPAHNIIGFSGGLAFSGKRHLIAVVGYESDRALKVIRALEPSSVTLAIGTVPTKAEFLLRNREAVREVLGSSNFELREVDVSHPERSADTLLKIVEDFRTENSLHFAPFSTKLSCLAIYALWQRDRGIRIWNAQPQIYNVLDYTKGSCAPRFFEVSWEHLSSNKR